MSVKEQFGAFRTILPMMRRSNRFDLLGWLRSRPQLLMGTMAFETAAAMSGRMDAHLKSLAELKAAALVNCEFCLDVGSVMARAAGVTDDQLGALPNFRDSDAFDADEVLVLEFAEAVTATPALVPDDLRRRLLQRFLRAELTELAAAIAWENNRGRLNQALGIRSAGFSQGAPCAVPERPRV